MSDANENEVDLQGWQIGDLRLTAFPAVIGQGGDEKRWEALVGRKPESAFSRNFGAEVEESGPFPPGKLTYRRSPRAIEWMLENVPNPEKSETYFGMSPKVLPPFRQLMDKWLAECPPLNRLGFGAALYLPVKDRQEAYGRLEQYLHLGLEYSEEYGDFLYQINRRRQSRSVRLKVNRLSKWTWLPLTALDTKWHGEACLLELDINTEPGFQGTLPQDRYASLFDELVDLGAEIAAKGDLP